MGGSECRDSSEIDTYEYIILRAMMKQRMETTAKRTLA